MYGSINEFLDPDNSFFSRGNHFFIKDSLIFVSYEHHFLVTEAKIYEVNQKKVSCPIVSKLCDECSHGFFSYLLLADQKFVR